MHQEGIFPIVSNIGQSLLRIKTVLSEKKEPIPASLSSVPSLINSLCEDLQDFAICSTLGAFRSIQPYLDEHPAEKKCMQF